MLICKKIVDAKRWVVFILNHHQHKIYMSNFVSNQVWIKSSIYKKKSLCKVIKKYTCRQKLRCYRKKLFHLLTCHKFSRVKKEENMSGTIKKPSQKTNQIEQFIRQEHNSNYQIVPLVFKRHSRICTWRFWWAYWRQQWQKTFSKDIDKDICIAAKHKRQQHQKN